MKTTFTFLFLLAFTFSFSQSKLYFYYDDAGNQIQRDLCINCLSKDATTNKEEITPETITEDNISYYPNPVKQELNLSWQLVDNTTITTINVYNLNGQLVKTYTDTKTNMTQIIPFQDYPIGVYMVELQYNNNEQKTIKIIKQ